MNPHPHPYSRARRRFSALAATVLLAGAGAVVTTSPAAQAAPVTVTDAELRWELNKESTSGAFAPGTWNLFSAGRLGNPGQGGQTLSSTDQGATWSNGAAAGWKNAEGNVTIEDLAADGRHVPTTWQGTRTNAAGAAVNTAGTTSDNVVSIGNGTGTLDAATDSGTITWDGDFTVVYYSGMSYFHVSDPRLTVTNGVGTVTATLGGYASSMSDTSVWQPLPETTVTLADLAGVDVTGTGVSVTPTYLGVVVTPPSGSSAQVTNGSSAGSFPQSFVDFQGKVGTASYWYSSGGAADVRKPATPIHVLTGGASAPTEPTPTTKAKGRAKIGWTTRPSARRAGTLKVTTSRLATGRAKVVLRKASANKPGKKVRASKARITRGSATVRLPKLGRGTYRVVVTVPGNDAVTRASSKKTFRVR
jgi:hypothetical protein